MSEQPSEEEIQGMLETLYTNIEATKTSLKKAWNKRRAIRHKAGLEAMRQGKKPEDEDNTSPVLTTDEAQAFVDVADNYSKVLNNWKRLSGKDVIRAMIMHQNKTNDAKLKRAKTLVKKLIEKLESDRRIIPPTWFKRPPTTLEMIDTARHAMPVRMMDGSFGINPDHFEQQQEGEERKGAAGTRKRGRKHRRKTGKKRGRKRGRKTGKKGNKNPRRKTTKKR